MSEVFSDAVVEIIGYRDAPYPQNRNVPLDPLVRHQVDQIFEFAEGLKPNWSELDLIAAGEWAKVQIADRFPFLRPEALDALAWACTFGWK